MRITKSKTTEHVDNVWIGAIDNSSHAKITSYYGIDKVALEYCFMFYIVQFTCDLSDYI